MNELRAKDRRQTQGQTRFGSGLRSGNSPWPSYVADEFERLKHRLLHERLAGETDSEMHTGLQLAAAESAALAWTTPYPMLVWPELLEESSRAARTRTERQRLIRARTRQTLAA